LHKHLSKKPQKSSLKKFEKFCFCLLLFSPAQLLVNSGGLGLYGAPNRIFQWVKAWAEDQKEPFSPVLDECS